MEEIKCRMSEHSRKQFDDIVNQRVLGASTHIHMIGEMFLDLAEIALEEKISGSELKENIKEVGDFFKCTRGEASCAVTNGINQMVYSMGHIEDKTVYEAVKTVKKAVEDYRRKSNQDIKKVAEYAKRLAEGMNKILVFDYSSTVNEFLKNLEPDKIQVYIPESRSINGGAEFAKTAVKQGLKVHFIPDAGIMYFLRQCDGAFCGAETMFPDGTAFNTIGTDMVGLICKFWKIPFYILTPMLKLDLRGIYGYQRTPVVNNLKHRFEGLGFTEQERNNIDFHCPELLPVAPSYITGFITEEGIIPTDGLYEQALAYGRKMGGDEKYDR